jgi:hypothetical protein
MKFVKGIAFGAIGLFVVVTMLSLLIPSKILTSKSVLINAPKDSIQRMVNDLNEWKKWHPIFSQASLVANVSNPSTSKNASIQWKSDGKQNSIVITAVSADDLRFNVDRKGERTVENSIVIVPMEGATEYLVEWRALNTSKWYPWEKFAGIFVSQITGPGYEAALQGLKTYVEQNSP